MVIRLLCLISICGFAAGAFECLAKLHIVLVCINLNVTYPGIFGLAFGNVSSLHYNVRRTSEVGYSIAYLPQLGCEEGLCRLFGEKRITGCGEIVSPQHRQHEIGTIIIACGIR